MDSEQEEPNITYIDEEEFIHESYRKNPFPFWLLLCIFAMVVAVFWGSRDWFTTQDFTPKSPFMQVTNRDFSLYLWQHPHLMRIHSPSKMDYLTGFQYRDKVSILPGEADQVVSASPELLFHYHTWDRLLRPEEMVRTITPSEFQSFLNYTEEWKPAKWPAAPPKYQKLVADLAQNPSNDIYPLLPEDVRRAFVGWKNYLYEGEQIAQETFTAKEVLDFLTAHPAYKRHFWYNLLKEQNPLYLKGLETLSADTEVPPESLFGFLRVALYNAQVKN